MSCMLVKTCLRWRGWCTLLWSQLVHGVARLLYHLAHSPLGSLSMNDLRRQQFVLVEGVLKLSDVDDMGVSEPFCQTHADCRHHLPANLTGQSIPNYSTYNSCCTDLSFTVYYRLCNQLGVSMILNESTRDEELCFHSIVKIHSICNYYLYHASYLSTSGIYFDVLWYCYSPAYSVHRQGGGTLRGRTVPRTQRASQHLARRTALCSPAATPARSLRPRAADPAVTGGVQWQLLEHGAHPLSHWQTPQLVLCRPRPLQLVPSRSISLEVGGEKTCLWRGTLNTPLNNVESKCSSQ